MSLKEGKLYYTIGELSQHLDVQPSTLRFWHQEFEKFINPKRNRKGNRLFTQSDVENFTKIHHFIKVEGMTIKGAQERMKHNPSGINNTSIVIEKLKKLRFQLMEIKEQL